MLRYLRGVILQMAPSERLGSNSCTGPIGTPVSFLGLRALPLSARSADKLIAVFGALQRPGTVQGVNAESAKTIARRLRDVRSRIPDGNCARKTTTAIVLFFSRARRWHLIERDSETGAMRNLANFAGKFSRVPLCLFLSLCFGFHYSLRFNLRTTRRDVI